MNTFSLPIISLSAALVIPSLSSADGPVFIGDVIVDTGRPPINQPVPRINRSVVTVDCFNGNTSIDIVDDQKSNRLELTLNERLFLFNSRDVTGFDLTLCGRSNNVDYQVGKTPIMTLPRNFKITGSDGFDYVQLNFQSNIHGQTVRYEKAPQIQLDLGKLSDQVAVRLQDFGTGSFYLDADLGEGHDGLTLLEYGGPMRGSATIMVDGGQGNDRLYVDLSNRYPTDIPASSSMWISVWGDEAGDLDLYDNVADHGQDIIVVEMAGEVNGSLASRVYGDDNVLRLRDVFCRYCIFRDSYSGLEYALKNQPDYANDNVQTRYAIGPGSSGEMNLHTSGGLANDYAVMVFEGEIPPALRHFDASLTGGQYHTYQTDTCWVDSTLVDVTQCNVMSPDISFFD